MEDGASVQERGEVEQQGEANEAEGEVVAGDNRDTAVEQIDLPPQEPIKFYG